MKVFVYGTLKSGKRRNFYLTRDNAKLLGEVKTEAKYMLYKPLFTDYPCMSECKQGISVEGELWEVTDETLAALDSVEGVPHLFHRATIKLDNGEEAIAYLMPKPLLARQLGSKWDG
jgi:gamma-glutamylcyclotransferase (GGCT)/AIG2-like uncharacterized protein YtfP